MTGIERLVDIVNDGPYSGGMIHISVHKLREICDQIEAEAGVETVKLEAMEALAFVEEHGGIEVIKERLLETIPHAVYDRIYRRKHRRIRELENELEDMRGRLIPEGMEWPMFEGGELVGFGDEYVNAKGNVSTLRTIVIKDCRDRLGGGYYWKLGKGACAVVVKNGERIKRPPVLAADGKPLESGQTVWEVDGTGHPFKVVSIRPSTGRAMEPTVVTCDVGDGTSEHFLPSQLTHQRPVLDADGVPIKKGDTVYFTDGREQECNTIVNAKYDYKDEPYVQLGRLNDVGYPTYTNCSCIDPSQLTHTKPEPPDSWDSVWMDVSNGCETPQGMERRCKALAERVE